MKRSILRLLIALMAVLVIAGTAVADPKPPGDDDPTPDSVITSMEL